MTCREKLKMEHPKLVDSQYIGGCKYCPHEYGYLTAPDYCREKPTTADDCKKCWDREIPGISLKQMEIDNGEIGHQYPLTAEEIKQITVKNDGPRILDSGNRREFESGAVRDIQEGKGRCDLLPLDVIWFLYLNEDHNIARVFAAIADFVNDGDYIFLSNLLNDFASKSEWKNKPTMIIEVSKHFEEGAKKYGDNNWRKGIPVRCYIDSAVRHYLKYLRGDKDEPHDRAFCWNIMCAIWTCKHRPELNEYAAKEE